MPPDPGVLQACYWTVDFPPPVLLHQVVNAALPGMHGIWGGRGVCIS